MKKTADISACDPIAEIEAMMAEHGVKWTDACNAAGIPQSTYWRWKQEPPKTLQLIAEMKKAILHLAESK